MGYLGYLLTAFVEDPQHALQTTQPAERDTFFLSNSAQAKSLVLARASRVSGGSIEPYQSCRARTFCLLYAVEAAVKT